MSTRSLVAFVVAISLVASSVPRAAYADEERAPVSANVRATLEGGERLEGGAPLGRVPRLFLTPGESIALTRPIAALPALGPTQRVHEIRLSKEAKTWIIVGAIVGGILLTVGVIVLAKPGKKL